MKLLQLFSLSKRVIEHDGQVKFHNLQEEKKSWVIIHLPANTTDQAYLQRKATRKSIQGGSMDNAQGERGFEE